MLTIHDCFRPEDKDYIISIRRRIHQHPELGFDLPHTLATVRHELDSLGVAYTEEFGCSAIVATVGAGALTIGLRGDMDALPMTEETDIPFRSQIPGQMHSCGHDAHTAILLGVARALKRVERQLPCRVKLLFQPSEECADSGAKAMADDGVMDDIDQVLALHQDIGVPSGSIGVFSGDYMAACHPYRITFHGKSAHATMPQNGHDALAMAVKAYNDIYLMKCREIGPFEPHILSISCLHAGTAHNIIADTATMDISFRFFQMDLHDRIDARIRQICSNAAEELGGTVTMDGEISAFPVVNDPALTDRVRSAAAAVVGKDHVVNVSQRMGSDDFSHFLRSKPGVLFRLGNGNPDKGCIYPSHNARFMLDEDILLTGAQVFVQYILDHQ